MAPREDLEASIAREEQRLADLKAEVGAVTTRLAELRKQLAGEPIRQISAPSEPAPLPVQAPVTNSAKVELFRSLFRGREDAFSEALGKREDRKIRLRSRVHQRVGPPVVPEEVGRSRPGCDGESFGRSSGGRSSRIRGRIRSGKARSRGRCDECGSRPARSRRSNVSARPHRASSSRPTAPSTRAASRPTSAIGCPERSASTGTGTRSGLASRVGTWNGAGALLRRSG